MLLAEVLSFKIFMSVAKRQDTMDSIPSLKEKDWFFFHFRDSIFTAKCVNTVLDEVGSKAPIEKEMAVQNPDNSCFRQSPVGTVERPRGQHECIGFWLEGMQATPHSATSSAGEQLLFPPAVTCLGLAASSRKGHAHPSAVPSPLHACVLC